MIPHEYVSRCSATIFTRPHARITIPGDENILKIRAARRQNKHAKDRDLLDNAPSSLRTGETNWQLELEISWANKDSNIGPRDYEFLL
jgi:hypothetical protein